MEDERVTEPGEGMTVREGVNDPASESEEEAPRPSAEASVGDAPAARPSAEPSGSEEPAAPSDAGISDEGRSEDDTEA